MGLDLRDLGGALSYRRLAVLLRHAPPGSAFAYSMYGEAGGWTRTDYILADLFDITAASHSPKKAKPYPRPKAKTERKRAPLQGLAQIRAFSEARQEGRRWQA